MMHIYSTIAIVPVLMHVAVADVVQPPDICSLHPEKASKGWNSAYMRAFVMVGCKHRPAQHLALSCTSSAPAIDHWSCTVGVREIRMALLMLLQLDGETHVSAIGWGGMHGPPNTFTLSGSHIRFPANAYGVPGSGAAKHRHR